MVHDVLIVGASGFVGGALLRAYGGRALGTYHRTPQPDLLALDVGDRAAVLDVVARLRPRLILHPAAQPNVDLCETEVDESYRVNVVGTRNVADAAERAGARYVYFSTDYVFDGRDGPAATDAQPAPLNVYGRHKLEAERYVREHVTSYVIARVCGVYGFHPQGKNFVMRLVENGRRGEPMRIPSDQWGTPTYVDNLADAVRELAALDFTGVAHPVGPDYLSRIEFARLAADVLGLDDRFLQPVTTPELGQAAARPLRGGVDNRTTQAMLATRLVGAREGLERFKRRMADGR